MSRYLKLSQRALIVLFFAFCPALSYASFGPSIDGELGDWGVQLRDGNHSTDAIYTYNGTAGVSSTDTVNPGIGGSLYDGNWKGIALGAPTPTSYTSLDGGWRGSKYNSGLTATLFYQVEDQGDKNQGGVGPESGGQAYDAEFMGAVKQGNTLYISIASGLTAGKLDGTFSPGDIRIETSAGSFGIETGGLDALGVGGVNGKILNGDAGVTWALNTSGSTTGYQASDGSSGGTLPGNPPIGAHNTNQIAGSIFKNAAWYTENVGGLPNITTQMTSVNGSAAFGQALGFVYKLKSNGTQLHAAIELAIDISLMGTLKSVQWGPSCGNDGLFVEFGSGGGNNVTPEPASLAIWGLGGICALAFARRRMQRKAA